MEHGLTWLEYRDSEGLKGPWNMAELGWSIGTLKVFKGPWNMAELGWSIGTLKVLKVHGTWLNMVGV